MKKFLLLLVAFCTLLSTDNMMVVEATQTQLHSDAHEGGDRARRSSSYRAYTPTVRKRIRVRRTTGGYRGSYRSGVRLHVGVPSYGYSYSRYGYNQYAYID